ncbi:C6 transcription factor, putative [Talaromyces stipitatus ATCC 10500]|uniref:C6 transcription factor, putative n=1 Tax=Talaromyces stipitatus (strain ATCC 10500 / CBS 375.48 / QM 6759 / NRRL 1006) TaxID=441959 RepID=B8MER8_TALSN|nr:C6 transcription factor, putative [Talaromyces stipitatus ATCC 10500]EED16951.1 C6 transcription factor, putative [Talaromyces stipitatus ATCC 10500]
MNPGAYVYSIDPNVYNDFTTGNTGHGTIAINGNYNDETKLNEDWNGPINGMSSTANAGTNQQKSAGPSPLACLACRQKHLKCDGRQPICGRCKTGELTCEYTPSRRGYKGPSKKRRANPQPVEQQVNVDPQIFNLDGRPPEISPEWHIPSIVGSVPSSTTPGGPVFTPPDISGAITASATTTGTGGTSSTTPQAGTLQSPMTPESPPMALGRDGYLVDVFYSNFHPAHPILPPPGLLYNYSPPAYLELVIKFIGAHFTPAASPETYRQAVVSATVDQEPCPEKVQALLLLTIVLHSRNERQEAGVLLAQAVDLAFELGIHRKSYAETVTGDPIRRESLRRTWWELFVIEGMLTALGMRSTFTAGEVPLEVPLPCEERIYQDGLAPPYPPTIKQFDDRIFAEEDITFSSFSYRIEAVRILGRVVSLSTASGQQQQEEVESVDARIASWFHHIPDSKMELMQPDGTMDEMMFQARMVINGASIYLNFPRSDLLSSPAVAAEVICGHSGVCLMPAFSHHAHAMRALNAASEISTLASLRMPVTKHTPFFICALVLSSIVQLAGYSVKAGQMPDPRRDRLTLTIGVFRSLGRTWAISKSVMSQIKAVARDVLEIGVRPQADQNNLDFAAFLEGSQYWIPSIPNA